MMVNYGIHKKSHNKYSYDKIYRPSLKIKNKLKKKTPKYIQKSIAYHKQIAFVFGIQEPNNLLN